MTADIRPEPLAELADEYVGLAERVAYLCEKHRAHHERQFAEKVLDLLYKAADKADPKLREAYESIIRTVKSLGGLEP